MSWKIATILLVGFWTTTDDFFSNLVQEELAKLEGTWKVESWVYEGYSLPKMANAKFVIKDNKMTIFTPDKSAQFSFQLDPTKTPRTIDFFLPKEEKSDTLGIYQMDDDTLKYCHTKASNGRPTDFSSNPGSGRNLMILKRVRP